MNFLQFSNSKKNSFRGNTIGLSPPWFLHSGGPEQNIMLKKCGHSDLCFSPPPKVIGTSNIYRVSHRLKYQFWKKSLRKKATLSSWTLYQHICPLFWAWLLLYSAITPKSEDKYVVKVFNWSQFHLFEMTLLQNPYFSTVVTKSKSEALVFIAS